MGLGFDGSNWVCVMSAMGRPGKRSGFLQCFYKSTQLFPKKKLKHILCCAEDPQNAQLTSHSCGASNAGSHR